MADEKNEQKVGAGHAAAMYRMGLAELRAAMYPGSNVAQPAQYGLYGTLTPGEVAESRRGDERDRNEEPGTSHHDLARRQEIGPSDEHREPPELERE